MGEVVVFDTAWVPIPPKVLAAGSLFTVFGLVAAVDSDVVVDSTLAALFSKQFVEEVDAISTSPHELLSGIIFSDIISADKPCRDSNVFDFPDRFNNL